MRICFVIWKILFFVSRGSVKVAPQKIHLMLPQRSATALDADAVTKLPRLALVDLCGRCRVLFRLDLHSKAGDKNDQVKVKPVREKATRLSC